MATHLRSTASRARTLAAAAAGLLAVGSSPADAQFLRETYFLAPTETIIESPVIREVIPTTSYVVREPLFPAGYVVEERRGLFGNRRSYSYRPTFVETSLPVVRSYSFRPSFYESSLPIATSYRVVRPTEYVIPTREIIYATPTFTERLVTDSLCCEPAEVYVDSTPSRAPIDLEVAPAAADPADDPEPTLNETQRRTKAESDRAAADSKVIKSVPSNVAETAPGAVAEKPKADEAPPPVVPAPPEDPNPPAADLPEPESPPALPTEIPGLDGVERRETLRPSFPTSSTVAAASVVGLVKSRFGGQGEPDLTVVFTDPAGKLAEHSARTDSTGQFSVANVPDGTWTLAVRNDATTASPRKYGTIRVRRGQVVGRDGTTHDSLSLNY